VSCLIDREWLDASLRFAFPDGGRLNGLAAVSGSRLVVRYREPDGRERELRLPRDRFELPSYLRELPTWITPAPRYDIEQLNTKLDAALGDPSLLLLVPSYQRLVETVLHNLYRDGIADLTRFAAGTDAQTEILWFLLRTPLVGHRLAEARGHRDPAVRSWARSAISALSRADEAPDRYAPATIADNPVVLWGGVMEFGYVTDEEIPKAVAAIEERLAATSGEQLETFAKQALALLNATSVAGGGVGLAVLCHAIGLTSRLWITPERARGRVRFATGFPLSGSGRRDG
jgi:hypothetical protein